MVKALLIVDIQNDFINGSLKVIDGLEIIKDINKVKDTYNVVILTQDSHPKNHVSFASNNNLPEFTEKKMNYKENEYTQIMWPDHCVKETYGEQFHSELNIQDTDIIVKKGENFLIDSYSAFFDNLKLNKTDLDDILKRNNVDTIDICGLAFDYCVKYSAIDSKLLGYNTNVIYNMTRSVNPDNDQENIKLLKKFNINILKYTPCNPENCTKFVLY